MQINWRKSGIKKNHFFDDPPSLWLLSNRMTIPTCIYHRPLGWPYLHVYYSVVDNLYTTSFTYQTLMPFLCNNCWVNTQDTFRKLNSWSKIKFSFPFIPIKVDNFGLIGNFMSFKPCIMLQIKKTTWYIYILFLTLNDV